MISFDYMVLIDAVMTPAGTAAEGMLILEKSAFRANVIKAVTSSTRTWTRTWRIKIFV